MRIRGLFKKLSIRAKLMFFMTTIIVVTSLFNLYFFYQAYIAQDEYNAMLKDYAQVNNLSIQLIAGRDCISRYIVSNDHAELKLYRKYRDQVNSLAGLILGNANSLDTYLWSRSIKYSIATYHEEINRIFSIDPRSERYFAQYNKAKNSSIYIENYIKQPLNVKLTEGEWYHQQLIRRVKSIRTINLISLIAITFFSLVYVLILSRNITQPLQKLTRFSMDIAKGNFNTARLDMDSSDDINILAFAFNKMVQSIQGMIEEITEKAKVERKLHQEEYKNLKISEQLNEARFLALQSQINPHFLFNTLNTISRLALFEKARQTTKLIQSLAEIFRYNLGSIRKEVLLTEELAIIKEYVMIQQTRFGERIGFDIISRGDIDKMVIPRLIVQPLVENAIVHGLEPKEDGGGVRVKIYPKDGFVIIKVIDNGTGISREQLDRILTGQPGDYDEGYTTGIGMTNVRERVRLYCKNDTCFGLQSKIGLGTVVTLKIRSNTGVGNACINY